VPVAQDTTPEVTSSGDWRFGDTVQSAIEGAEAARSAGADLVIGVIQANHEYDREIMASHAFDVILSGDDHDYMTGYDGITAYVETSTEARYLSPLDLEVTVTEKDGKRSVSWEPSFRFIDTRTVEPDPETQKLVEQERKNLELQTQIQQSQDAVKDHANVKKELARLRAREDALRLAKETAELANRTKSEFLASMSHELRTPLNAIIGFSEIMSDEMLGPIGTPQYKGYIDDITDSAKHLLIVINDILDVAKIESGHIALSEEVVDPTGLAGSVMRLVSPRSDEANVTLSLIVPENLPALRADKTKLKQILINLLSNAVKFTPEGGRVELRAELAENGDFLFIVHDTGIGMSEADIRIALTPFGQVDSRLSRRFEGTGLGLPLAQGLTEMHGGSFKIESEPGQGTTISVRLPAERVFKG